MQRNVALPIIIGIAAVSIAVLFFIGDFLAYWFGAEPVVNIEGITITCDPSKGTAWVLITSRDATPDLDQSRYSAPATMTTSAGVVQTRHDTDAPNPLHQIHEIYEFENTGATIGTASGTFTVYDKVDHLEVKTITINIPNPCPTPGERDGPLTQGEIGAGTITGL